MPQLTRHLEEKFDRYKELAAALPNDAFGRRLGALPSNTIGEQLWCVVGTRESYARALDAGHFSGWACSLSSSEAGVVRQALAASADGIRQRLDDGLDEARQDLALQLLEHEAQHMGQLLRYLLGLGLGVPEGWRTYFAL